jgi:hypothetical protein
MGKTQTPAGFSTAGVLLYPGIVTGMETGDCKTVRCASSFFENSSS